MAGISDAVVDLITINGNKDGSAGIAETQKCDAGISGADVVSETNGTYAAHSGASSVTPNSIGEYAARTRGASPKRSCRTGSVAFANIFLNMNLSEPARGIGGDGHMSIFSCGSGNEQSEAL